MRELAQTRVLKFAAGAALASAILCLPRLVLWTNREHPVWYLDAVIFTGGFVLWAFVFAWHTKYTGRPVFTLNISARDLTIATGAGIGVAIAFRVFLDPLARQAIPQDYPLNLEEWLAMYLFTLSLSQLLVVFAPFAWLMRLSKSRTIAFALTVLFGLVVLAIKLRLVRPPISPLLFSALFVARLIVAALSLAIYLRGGVLLTWWLGFLIHLRSLPI